MSQSKIIKFLSDGCSPCTLRFDFETFDLLAGIGTKGWAHHMFSRILTLLISLFILWIYARYLLRCFQLRLEWTKQMPIKLFILTKLCSPFKKFFFLNCDFLFRRFVDTEFVKTCDELFKRSWQWMPGHFSNHQFV